MYNLPVRRGTVLEMVLAVIGTFAWLGLGLLGLVSHSPLNAVIGFGLAGLSVVEILRWQQGHPAMAVSGVRRASSNRRALPVAGWWGVGGLAGAFLLGFLWAAIRGSLSGMPALLPYAVYLASGGGAVWLLSRKADRREAAGTDERPGRSAPPPPAGAVSDHPQSVLHDTGSHDATVNHLREWHGSNADPRAAPDVLVSLHASRHPRPRASTDLHTDGPAGRAATDL